MSDTTEAQHFLLECQKCGEWKPAHIPAELLSALEEAGIEPDEVIEKIDAGLSSWQLTCDACTAAADELDMRPRRK